MNIIFYTKDFDKKITEPVVVILSPQYYWIKKIEIPVKSIFQAKKIAKNLFDLEEEKYIFGAFRAGEFYYAYAIEKNLELKIEKKYIKALYLAQSELFMFECVNVDENHSIKKINDILFCFPKDDSENCEQINDIFKKIKLSKNKISLDTLNIEKSTLILIFLIFIIANVSFFTAGYLYKNYINGIEKQKTEYAKKHNLPVTSYQLASIYESFKNTDKTQKQIKKDLEYFTNTPLDKNDVYKKIVFNSRTYEIEINSKKNFDGYFKKRFKIINSYNRLNKYTAKLGHE